MNLRELILTRCAELGITYAEVARRATAAGYPVSGGTIARLAKLPDESPKKTTLLGLVVALEVAPHVVGQATTETLGLPFDRVQATEDGGLRFEIPGNGWSEEQLARFHQVMQRAYRRERDRQALLAQQRVLSLPRSTPTG